MADQLTPKRIQRQRTKGWRMPEGAVYVGRPTRWGNPFRVIRSTCCPTVDVIDDNGVTYVIDHDWAHAKNWSDVNRPGAWKWARSEAVRLFAMDISQGWMPYPPLSELRGKDLVCWCPLFLCGEYAPCHADVLISIANDIPIDEVVRENTRWAARETL